MWYEMPIFVFILCQWHEHEWMSKPNQHTHCQSMPNYDPFHWQMNCIPTCGCSWLVHKCAFVRPRTLGCASNKNMSITTCLVSQILLQNMQKCAQISSGIDFSNHGGEEGFGGWNRWMKNHWVSQIKTIIWSHDYGDLLPLFTNVCCGYV